MKSPNEISTAIADALGLPGARLSSLTLTLAPNQFPVVKTESPIVTADGLVIQLQEYRLVPRQEHDTCVLCGSHLTEKQK